MNYKETKIVQSSPLIMLLKGSEERFHHKYKLKNIDTLKDYQSEI